MIYPPGVVNVECDHFDEGSSIIFYGVNDKILFEGLFTHNGNVKIEHGNQDMAEIAGDILDEIIENSYKSREY